MADIPQTLQDILSTAAVTRPPSRFHGVAGLPVAQLLRPPASTSNRYTVTSVDHRGRLADRSPIRLLNWHPLQPITITPMHEQFILVTSVPGNDRVTQQGQLRLPTFIRRTYRLTPGTRLLAVTCPEPQLVALYPASTLDTILLTHHLGDPS